MLFNSIDYLIFLILVFSIYWILNNKNLKIQNTFLLIVSYIFYGWWDWRFLSLIFLSSLIDYIIGLLLDNENTERKRKLYLSISIFFNLGLLAFFKYFNFFLDSFYTIFPFLNQNEGFNTLSIILPVGISFYTFQTMSYSIDIYRRKMKATKDFIAFFAFVSFFPQLVAGPIERASNLLPQFFKKRRFNYHKSVDGLRQILWGLFKKIVIADSCGMFVNEVFSNIENYNSLTLVLTLFIFTFQVYADFSGYSDIAIGSARLLGFNLMKNFDFPLFSKNFPELWRKWHISMSSWFRDYIFYPMGGIKRNIYHTSFNILFLFAIIGLWHGADWTFVIFGLLNGGFYMLYVIMNRNNGYKKLKNKINKNSIFKVYNIIKIFILFSLTGIFFRAENIDQALVYIRQMTNNWELLINRIELENTYYMVKFNTLFLLLSMFLIIEWLGKENEYGIEKILLKQSKFLRFLFYYTLIIFIYLFSSTPQDFVYFNF